jgi:hypothetical protein
MDWGRDAEVESEQKFLRPSVFETTPPPPRLCDLISHKESTQLCEVSIRRIIGVDENSGEVDRNEIGDYLVAVAADPQQRQLGGESINSFDGIPDDESEGEKHHDDDLFLEEPSLDCYSKDFRNKIVTNPDANLTPRVLAFSFLLSARVRSLKGPIGELKRHRLRQDVCEQSMVCMLMRTVSKAVAAGGCAVSFDYGLFCKKGDAQRWKSRRVRTL